MESLLSNATRPVPWPPERRSIGLGRISLTRGGMATAGLVLGIISLVLNVVGLIARLAMMR